MGMQGSSPINTDQLNKIATQMQKMSRANCDQIEMILLQHLPSVKNLVSGIGIQIAGLGPWASIGSLPGNPLKIIPWLAKLVTASITPQLLAAIKLATQLAQLAIAIAKIAAAAAAIAKNLKNCKLSAGPLISAIEADIAKAIGPALHNVAAMQAQLHAIHNLKIQLNTSSPKAFLASVNLNGAAFNAQLNKLTKPPGG
jgi:hypothetical protein